ncbi:MAG: DUF4214 domain-containing protein [Cellulomonadaceae bacterium]|nr:DUF4214 domain-containing protein [Cellulomonadaceae bacterium]
MTRSMWSAFAAASLVAGLAQVGGPASAVQTGPASPTGATAPTSAQTAAVVQSGTAAIRAYVTKVYDDLFHRAPDPAGLATWTGQLASGTPYGAVANAITSSDEYRSRLIRGSYTTYLDRGPDSAGLAFWLDRMSGGQHIEDMQAGFIASDEFYARGGGTPRGWVTRLYQTVLGRTAAAGEVDWWVSAIAAGMNRGTVARGFLYSSEHLTTVVDGYYVDLLDRHIDPSGQSTWVGLIQQGHRDEEIIAAIVSSSEYRSWVVDTTQPPTVRIGHVVDGPQDYVGMSISNDGRWIAFESEMRLPGDDRTGWHQAVYLWDNVTGATTLVSPANDGTAAEAYFSNPSISADGRWVAFTGAGGLYVWDRLTATTSMIEDEGHDPSISADGRWVSYERWTTDGTGSAVYVADRTSGTTTLVSTTAQVNAFSEGATISADGRWVAFSSHASDLVEGDTDGTTDVFLWDRTTARTVLASVDQTGQASGGSFPSISADGGSIAYYDGGTEDTYDILVWSRSTGTTSTVVRGISALRSAAPTLSISADGRRVAYDASDILPAEPGAPIDVFVTDTRTGATSLVSNGADGAAADNASLHAVISGDGRWVAYYSYASNLVAGGSPGIATDLFVTGPITG